jgi:hypothetical protein
MFEFSSTAVQAAFRKSEGALFTYNTSISSGILNEK